MKKRKRKKKPAPRYENIQAYCVEKDRFVADVTRALARLLVARKKAA